MMMGRRLADLLRGLAATAVLVALLGGVPIGLYVFGGSPFPDHLPDWPEISARLTSPDTDYSLLLGTVRIIGWLAWAMFLAATTAETIAYISDRPALRLPGLTTIQPTAGRLVATAALVLTGGASLAEQAATHHAAAATSAASPSKTSRPASPGIQTDPAHRRDVERGDTLWGIAHDEYGKGSLYRKIFRANKGRKQPPGIPRLTDPNEIYPGERLIIPGTIPPEHKPRKQREHSPAASPRPTPLGSQPNASQPSASRATPPSTPEPSSISRPQAGPAAPEPHQPTTPRTATPHGTTSHAAPSAPGDREPGPTAVQLPTGALVGLSLAAAISTALAATRLHRRRRRTPNPDRLGVAEPEPPASPAVAALRKAHLDSYTDAGQPVPTDHDLLAADQLATPPTHITAGLRDEQPVIVALAGLNVAFTGPGAADTARAIATELLTSAHHSRVELLIPEPDAAALFNLTETNLAHLGDTVPGLIVTPDLDGALRHLETEVLHRARMMNDHNAPDLPQLRTADPGEPLPAIVLIAHTDETERLTPSLHASLQLAERYGVGGLLLGPWPAGTTCHIEHDGRVRHADGPNADTWKNAQLFHLPVTDTTDLLHIIPTARGVEEPQAAPNQPPAPTPRTGDDHPAQGSASLHPPDLQDDQTRPVRLRLFGPVRVETADGQPATGLRRISRDLLAYLALHPDGITRERGVDAILPDRDLEAGTTMFHTAINNTRQTLRKATGLREPMFITHAAGRYRLDPYLIDVDLWPLLRALDTARAAETDTARIAALRQLADLYNGELADDITHEWAELERERIRRTATDALVRLARLLQDEHPNDALAALEQAFTHHPTSEPLAQDLMRLQTQLGQPDAARRTHHLLTQHLNNLDIDPTEETNQLLMDLLRQHKS